MKTAYSYTRLSSTRQIEGTGKQRQMARPIEICKQYGWELSPKTFSDLGVSSFKGKNRLRGDLANFIELAKAKKLGQNPVLIIEAFDRFSREDIDASEPAILNLLLKGVDIFVAYSNQLFTKDSTKELTDRIAILVSLKQAHDFSKNLSNRLKSASAIRKGKINAGEVMKVRHAPTYYTWNGQRYVQNEHSKTVKRMIKEYLNGQTIYGISNLLNSEGVKSFGYTGKNWSRQVVRDTLINPAIYGKFYDNEKFFSQPITDKATFNKIQVMIKQNSGNKGKFNSEYPNIFKGLCKCAYCGESMVMGVETKNSKTGKLRNEPYRYLRCSSISNSKPCKNRHNMNLKPIEDEFFSIFLQKDPAELLTIQDTEHEQEIVELQTQLNNIDTKISRLLDMDDGEQDIKSKLAEFRKLRQTITGKLSEISFKTTEQTLQKENLNVFQGLYKKLIGDEFTTDDMEQFDKALTALQKKLKDVDFRNKVKAILPTLIKRIEFDTINAQWRVFDLSGERIYTSVVA